MKNVNVHIKCAGKKKKKAWKLDLQCEVSLVKNLSRLSISPSSRCSALKEALIPRYFNDATE